MNSIKTVDIIIPTYKPDEQYIRLLELLTRQTYKWNHLYVINTEKSIYEEFMASHRNPIPADKITVEHISTQNFDHAGTRKNAVLKSDSEFFVMMTQDAIPVDETLIERLIAPFEGNDWVAVSYARQLPKPGAGLIESFVRQFNYPNKSMLKSQADVEKLGIKAYFCSDVCAAYRRSAYDSVGGFIDRAIFNEDMIFACSAAKKGFLISYTADALVYHSHSYSAKEQFHRNFDLAVSQKDHPEVFENLPSEGEGKKLVKECISYLCSKRRPWLIPGFIVNCAGRFLGYKLGKKYKLIPKKLLMKLSSNKQYWLSGQTENSQIKQEQ